MDGIAIIAAQHVMTSTLKLFFELKKAGLDPRKTFIVGKCYSTSRKVFDEFVKNDFQIHPHSLSYNSHNAFDVQYQEYLEEFVNQALAELSKMKVKKLIVIDDGGYLIEKIQKCNPPYEISCIEQTSAGANYLKNFSLGVPVINVAKSRAKLSLETPFIVEASLKRLFKQIPQKRLFGKKVLITGKGVIGTYVGRFLGDVCDVDYYDINEKEKVDLKSLVDKADFIIGCSGALAVKYEVYAFRSNPLILLSLSSSDREFEGHKMRRAFPVTNVPHKNYSLGGVFLMNGGFPINFWGTKNNMRMEKIELTMGLLLGGIYQSVLFEADRLKGIVNLDEEFERLIIAEFEKKSSRLYEEVNSLKDKIHSHLLLPKKVYSPISSEKYRVIHS